MNETKEILKLKKYYLKQKKIIVNLLKKDLITADEKKAIKEELWTMNIKMNLIIKCHNRDVLLGFKKKWNEK